MTIRATYGVASLGLVLVVTACGGLLGIDDPTLVSGVAGHGAGGIGPTSGGPNLGGLPEQGGAGAGGVLLGGGSNGGGKSGGGTQSGGTSSGGTSSGGAGTAGACGNYQQACCSTGTECMAANTSCIASTCQCSVGSNRCNNACVSGSSVTQCGPSCLDCSQPNANAACDGTKCANTCIGGYTLSACGVDSTGHPSCSEWDFESNDSRYPTEGWMIDSAGRSASELATYGPLAISSAMAMKGTHSLAVPVTVADVTNVVVIRVPLCSNGLAIDMTGKSMGFNVRFVTASDSPNLYLGGGNYALLYTSPTSTTPGLGFAADPDVNLGDSPWRVQSGDIVTHFGISGPFTHAGFLFVFQGAWRGTIYVDDFKIY